MRSDRWQLLAILITVTALLVSCGKGETNIAKDNPFPGDSGSPMGVRLPAPRELLTSTGRSTSGVKLLERMGADTDPALAPHHAAVEGDSLRFSPNWSVANRAPSELAYALYRFTVTGYHGARELHLSYSGDPGDGESFVAVADFVSNHWSWLPVDADGRVTLTDELFENAKAPGMLELFAVPVLTGTTSRVLDSIRVGPAPGALQILAVSPTTISQWDSPVFFPAFTGEEPLSWTWNFGGANAPDPPIIAGMTPKPRMMGNAGTFNCSVTGQPKEGAPVVFNFVLTILDGFDAPPSINTIYPNSGETGAAYQPFYTGLGGSPTSASWNFGGGATPNVSSDLSPQVTLGAPGVYSGSVTMTNSLGTVSKDFTLYVVEPGAELPPSLFDVSASSSTVYAGTTAEMTALKTGGGDATEYLWEFEANASPSTSTEQNPVIFFQQAGVVRGKVTGTNSAGTSTADFEISVLQPSFPDLQSVIFEDVYTGIEFSAGASSTAGQGGLWLWDFGGGAVPNTSTEATPYVTPTAPGTYQGHVMVSNAIGSDRLDFEFTVTDPPKPQLDEVFSTALTTNILSTLSAWNTGGPATSWSWSFPSGIESPNPEQPYPSVTGLAAGSYDCVVTASNISGSDTLEFVLTVEDMLPPEITGVWPGNVISGQSSSFIAQTNCTFSMTWTWDFGGGTEPNTSTEDFPNVTVGVPGVYEGVVTATNEGGTTVFPFTYTVQAAE